MEELDELRLRVAKAKGYILMYGRMDRASSKPQNHFIGPDGRLTLETPDWPREISAAWELAEEMRLAKCWVLVDTDSYDGNWSCSVQYIAKVQGQDECVEHYADGETVPEAICRAWLDWKGAK
jgi:hypothetical protein